LAREASAHKTFPIIVPLTDYYVHKEIDVIVIPMRLKLLAASGVLAGGLGAAALSGAFAAPAPDVASAPAAAPTATATAVAAPQAKTGTRVKRFERGYGFLSPVAGFLGISETDLQTALRHGQTLAQIAQAHGKSTNDLKTFLTNQLKTRLDDAVKNGRITSQQETTMLNNASSRFDKLINTNFQQVAANRPGRVGGPWFGGAYLSTVAQTLGMNVADVRTELQNGKTLAQIAQEHGKTSADLENAIIASLKPRLDQLMNTNFKNLAAQGRAWRGHRGAPGQAPAPTATPKSS
jgi:lambda repressor-like predicted transcriptional regulator